jgi:hypothetical protein
MRNPSPVGRLVQRPLDLRTDRVELPLWTINLDQARWFPQGAKTDPVMSSRSRVRSANSFVLNWTG